jgi:hypothetical protein
MSACRIYAISKPTIAVLDFSFNNVSEDAGRILRNKIEFLLYSSGKFNILERNRLDILKKENRLSGININSREYAIEAGRILPAHYIVTGSVTFRDKYFIHISVVDVLSGLVIYSFDEDYESENMIYSEAEKIEKGIEDKIYRSLPEENAEFPVKTDFYLSLHAGYIPPVRKAEEFSSGGFIIDSEFGLKDLFIDNMNAGVNAGYQHFYRKGAINYSSIIPLLVTTSYTFEISLIRITPGFGAGTSYITIDKPEESSSAFEPCVSFFIKGDIMLSDNIGLEISSNYYTIYEPDGNIDYLSFNVGIVSFL